MTDKTELINRLIYDCNYFSTAEMFRPLLENMTEAQLEKFTQHAIKVINNCVKTMENNYLRQMEEDEQNELSNNKSD